MAEMNELLNKVLKQIASEQNFVNYNFKIEEVFTGGANYTSTLYNVTITEHDNSHHVFVKVAAMGEKVRSQAPHLYRTEIFVYTKLMKIYNKLQDEHRVPIEFRFRLPKLYGCNPTLYEETVALENLATKGYQAYDRFKSINWEYSKSAMAELCKMHALSYAYSYYHPEEFQKVLDSLKIEWQVEGNMAEYFDNVTKAAIRTVQEESKDKLKRFFEIYGKETFPQFFKDTRKPALIHGDFRPSNLMHRLRDDGTVEIKVVDLQTLQGSSPVVDLLYFIFTGSDEKFRAQYYDKLLNHYYTELAAAMRRLHLDPEKIYSRDDFDTDMKEKLPFGLTIAVFALPVITVAAENAPKVNGDLDLTSFSVDNTSDLFSERLNGVVNDYVKWGILK